MLLQFTYHAQIRIEQRLVSIEDVKRAIRNPDSSKVGFEGRTIVSKKIDGRILEVVYFKDTEPHRKAYYRIITLYFK